MHDRVQHKLHAVVHVSGDIVIPHTAVEGSEQTVPVVSYVHSDQVVRLEVTV